LVGFLSVGPVSRGFSIWACGFVGSILSRAEAAARYLVIAQAASIMARSGTNLESGRFSEVFGDAFLVDETEVSLTTCRERLKALRAVLMDLPRHAARLIRRIEKHTRRAVRGCQVLPKPDRESSVSICGGRRAVMRIERPPDKGFALIAIH